jgi:hypothetical protein
MQCKHDASSAQRRFRVNLCPQVAAGACFAARRLFGCRQAVSRHGRAGRLARPITRMRDFRHAQDRGFWVRPGEENMLLA